MALHGAQTHVSAIGVRNDNGLCVVLEKTCAAGNVHHFLRPDLVGIGFAGLRVTHSRKIVGNHVVVLC